MPTALPLVPTITPLPDAPSRQDADNFDTRADAFLAAMENLPTELNAAIAVINGEIKTALESSPGTAAYQAAAEAQASAAAAMNSEMNAAASAASASGLATGAGIWSGEQAASFVDAVTLRLTGNWTEAAQTDRALSLVQTSPAVVRVVSAAYDVGGYTDVVVDGAVDAGLSAILWGVPALSLPFTIGSGPRHIPRNEDFGTAAAANLVADPANPAIGDVPVYVDDGNGNPIIPGVFSGTSMYIITPTQRIKPDGSTDTTLELPPGRYRIRMIGGGGATLTNNASAATNISGSVFDGVIRITSAQAISFAGVNNSGAVSIGNMITCPGGAYCTNAHDQPFGAGTIGTIASWADDGTNIIEWVYAAQKGCKFANYGGGHPDYCRQMLATGTAQTPTVVNNGYGVASTNGVGPITYGTSGIVYAEELG